MEFTKTLTFLAGLLLGGALGSDSQPRADVACHLLKQSPQVVTYQQDQQIGFVPHLIESHVASVVQPATVFPALLPAPIHTEETW